MARDWWFYEGLRHWREQRQLEHRKLMTRYARLQRQNHPQTASQGRLIDVNARIIALIGDAMKAESVSDEREGCGSEQSERVATTTIGVNND